MKYKFMIILVGSMITLGWSQNVINPYKIFTSQSPSVPIPYEENQSSQLVYHSYLPGFGNGYAGEYMIAIREHPVTNYFNALTYKIEAVSYPFTINCWNDAGGCAYPVLPEFERKLLLPDEPYDPVSHSWGTSVNFLDRLYN